MSVFSLLLVDDELPLLGLLKKYLERGGYLVETAADGASALAAAQAGKFDVIVLDLNLPDMTGEEVMLKLMDTTPLSRFLICSGIPYGTEHLQPSKASRVSFLLKPFTPSQLSTALTSLMAERREASI